MTCECGGKFSVMDSYTENQVVYRRRKCSQCGELMYTTETEGGLDDVVKVMKMLNKKARCRP